jgi:hypothetical protein
VEDSKRLRQENAKLNLKVGTLISKNHIAWKQAEAAVATAERIRMFAHQVGKVVAKAELFDEKIGIGSKPSGTRIALILTDYSEKLERVFITTHDRLFPYYVLNSSIKHSKSDSKDRSQEIL